MFEDNKAMVRRLIEDVWNKGNLPLADELIASTYTGHDPSTPELGRGPELEKKKVTLYRTAFPNLRVDIEDMIAEREMVVARWTIRGTHKGDLSGIAPTGKNITLSGVSICRLSGGKIVEGWDNWDALGMYQQLGVAPEAIKTMAATR